MELDYRCFDSGLSLQSTKLSARCVLLTVDVVLQLTSDKSFETIFSEPFYIDCLEYFLSNCPSPCTIPSLDKDLRKIIYQINHKIFTAYSDIVSSTQQDISLRSTESYKRLIKFQNVYNLVRLFGHVDEIREKLVLLITMIVSDLSIQCPDHFPDQYIFQLLQAFIDFLQIPSKIHQINLLQMMDFLSVCQFLLSEINYILPFTNNVIQKFIFFFNTFHEAFNNSEHEFQDLIDHINISCMKLIECLFDQPSLYNPETPVIFMNFLFHDKLIHFCMKYGQLETHIYPKIKPLLDPYQLSICREKLEFSHLNPNVKLISAIYPDLDPEIIDSLLQIYPNPDILVSKLMDEPDIVRQLSPKTSRKKPRIVCIENKTIVPETTQKPDRELKNISIKLVEEQEKEYQEKVETTKRKLMKAADVSGVGENSKEYNDDFDESDEELCLLKMTSSELIDEILAQDEELK